MRTASLFFVPAIIVVAVPAQAGEDLRFGPIPDWVVPYEVGPGEDVEADLPVRALESDFQTRLEPGRVVHFIEMAFEFIAPQGLQAGNISVSWRPEFDDITIHHVLIERDGETIDVLADGQEFTILRREENLEIATLTGVLTANMFPAGLEVGDTLRFAYSLDQANPVMGEHTETILGPLNGIIDKSHVRLSWPRDLDLTVSVTDDLPAIEQGREDGYEYAALSFPKTSPVVLPEGAPSRFAMVRMVEASTFADWAELSAHFAPLYEEAKVIPAEGPLRDRLEAIRASSADPVERAEQALALVQDQVRYVALAMGAAGLVPADSETTWRRRYGDCKAKTALLIGLLEELGIDAEPVLVNSLIGDALPQRLPLVSAFDHVIVRAHIDGREYFLDGTRTGDTSLERHPVPSFSWGLPVMPQGAELIRMVPAVLATPSDDISIRIDLSEGIRTQAPTQAEVTYRGETAIAVNGLMQQLYGQARDQSIEDFWSNRYSFFNPEEVAMEFDEEAGELRISATGTSELDWDYNSFEPTGMRVGYTPDFDRPASADQDAPYAIAYPQYERVSYEVILPPGFSAENLDGANVEETVAGVEYRRQLEVANDRFIATRSARSLVPEISASEARAAEDALRLLREKRVFLRIPENYRLSRAEIDSMARAEGTDADDLMNQGLALMDAGEWRAARAVMDRVVSIEPENSWGYANRAVILARLGDTEAARADIVEARSRDPQNYVASHAEGLIASIARDWDAAIAAYTAAIEMNEDNYFAYGQRAEAYASKEDFDSAIADADRLLDIQPENAWGYISKGFLLARARRTDELEAHVTRMEKAFPADPSIASAASQMLADAGLEESAAVLLERAVVDGGSPIALVTRAGQRPDDANDMKLADLDEALAIDPDFIPALMARARVLWDDYELERALVDAERVIELQPSFEGGYDMKIIILLDMERETEAIAMVDELVERFPGDPMMLRSAAGFYRELRQYEKSDATMARAREILPDEDFFRSINMPESARLAQ
ncbi:DUF3857 domain-containing protein [Aurantiacibacter hainanensis]|uniref:DUF3857 domain-containing protein n=1 Tax=Aurantiacibacter hainanensis TaxID=3076114 RepID=UPI0030C6E2CC